MLNQHKLLAAGIIWLAASSNLYAGAAEKTGAAAQSMKITSKDFQSGERIPKKYTADGSNVSPELTFSAPPAAAQSLALLCDDPDAPSGIFTHWIIYDLDPKRTELAEGIQPVKSLSDGSKQGRNSFGGIGYSGPAPPPGKLHHYNFTLLALDARLKLTPAPGAAEFEAAVKGHVLSKAQLVGTYSR